MILFVESIPMPILGYAFRYFVTFEIRSRQIEVAIVCSLARLFMDTSPYLAFSGWRRVKHGK